MNSDLRFSPWTVQALNSDNFSLIMNKLSGGNTYVAAFLWVLISYSRRDSDATRLI